MEFGLFTLFDFFPDAQDEAKYYADTLELATLGEQVGFRSMWVGEEHFYSFGICPSPQIFLAAFAQRTDTMRLGTSVSLLPFDHPVRKAEDFAMVDLLSGGRLDLGVGRGSISRHFQGFSVDPAESKPRYEESLEIIKRAWTEPSCSYEGQFWTVDGVTVSPKPAQQPHPPIYRGTVSPESYEAAALAGDNVFLTPWLVGPHEEVKRRVDRYRELYVSSTLDRGREASVFMLFCNDDQRAAIREAKEVTGRYVRHITSFRKSKQLAHGARSDGSTAEDPQSGIFDQLEFMLSIEDHVEERAIVGTPAACIRRLEELGEELGGLDRVLTYFHAGARDIEAARQSMELFGKEVIPHFDQS